MTNTNTFTWRLIIQCQQKGDQQEDEGGNQQKMKVMNMKIKTCLARRKTIKKKTRRGDLHLCKDDQHEHKHDHVEEVHKGDQLEDKGGDE